MRPPRNQNRSTRSHEIGALRGRRHAEAAPNSLKFMANVEGVETEGHIRGANGMRWRQA